MHIKRIMVAALTAAMVVTATAPAFAETGNMELEQKNPAQAEEIISSEERKEDNEKIEAEKKEAIEKENQEKRITGKISPAAAKDIKDYEMVVLNKSKQKLSIRIDTKNKDITKYEVELRRKATSDTCVIEERRTITSKENICSFKRLMSPGEKYTIVIKSYNEKEKKWSFPEYSEITMDNSFAYKIMSNKEAVRAISNAVNNHKSTVTITASSDIPFYDGVYYGKWGEYNAENFNYYNSSNGSYFTYNGRSYFHATYRLRYNLSASKDKALRKKYTSISKKAKGSTKSKIKYFNSYLVKNCKYKLTNKPTNYEFLISWKKGQCSHYANAMKILCDISGIRCEYVAGKVSGGRHAWNIIKIGKKWYWFDSCWADKGKKIDKRWCFKGSGNKAFKKRKLDSKYRTKSWKKAHPMGTKSLKY